MAFICECSASYRKSQAGVVKLNCKHYMCITCLIMHIQTRMKDHFNGEILTMEATCPWCRANICDYLLIPTHQTIVDEQQDDNDDPDNDPTW